MAFGKPKIVAVDDSAIVLKMLGKVLNKKYELHPFSTGERALQFLKDEERKPDLIILDIDMPEMNGYEVLEEIKEIEHLDDVPVIFLTSNNDRNNVIKAVVGGAKDYVIKPIDEEILLNKIRNLLGK